jgi:hypothetical protein
LVESFRELGISSELLSGQIVFHENYFSLEYGGVGMQCLFLGLEGFAYFGLLFFVEWCVIHYPNW